MDENDAITLEPMENVTRVEVISERGRDYLNMDCHSVQISQQDQGRTIKIFLRNKGALVE